MQNLKSSKHPCIVCGKTKQGKFYIGSDWSGFLCDKCNKKVDKLFEKEREDTKDLGIAKSPQGCQCNFGVSSLSG